MSAIPVFYSFHYANDVMRVQQIRNIGAVEDNKPVSANDWEEVKRYGKAAIENWIDENMKYRRCVVVLVGSETAEREWVKHEIRNGWEKGKGLLGIHIHNLNCPRNGVDRKGRNPFEDFTVSGTNLSRIVRCYDPAPNYTYLDIANNIDTWVDEAIHLRKSYL